MKYLILFITILGTSSLLEATPIFKETRLTEQITSETSINQPDGPIKNFSVSIDWTNEVNRNHMGYDVFHKWSPKKIKELYVQNLKLQEADERMGNTIIEGLITDQDEYNSLIYTVIDNNVTRLDTLKNRVNPESYFLKIKSTVGSHKAKRLLKKYSSEGSLPEGIISSVGVNGRREVDISIDIKEKASEVQIEILNKNKEVVTTLVNEKLDIGNYEYEWNKGDEKVKGIYYIKFSVDDHTRLQRLKIKR